MLAVVACSDMMLLAMAVPNLLGFILVFDKVAADLKNDCSLFMVTNMTNRQESIVTELLRKNDLIFYFFRDKFNQ
ncbi:MAG: hypothetical protein F6K10_21835 [Moorea sp. SIO2B7]|nr:hypothetical protein [Moorena sp. SIO2B7]